MSALRLTGLLAVATIAMSLVACSATPGGGSVTSNGGTTFPVTIEHVYGSTTLTEQPQRVASIAWANHEVPLALGIVPVGMSKATWGDDDGDGVLPWVEQKLEELGADTPVLFDETDGIDFEAVADTRPDVILASYSGLTREEYDLLSKIAPVVAYEGVAWGTTMNDMIRLNSQALGLAAEGDELITDLDARVRASLEKHPELAGTKILFSSIDPTDLSRVSFYTSHDTRPGFLADLGMPMPIAVDELSAGTDEFFVSVSSEQADRFDDVDVFVTYGEADGAIVTQLQADPLLSTIPAVARGSIAVLQNSTPLAASANPSPLSIGWGVDDYFALLSAAIAPAG